MHVFELASLDEQRQQQGRVYLEFLRVPALSAGLYVLAAGATDPQQPHGEAEVYHVVRGRGAIQIGEESQPLAPGTTVYVPARMPHRFHSITEELTLLVVFAPAESCT